MSISFCMDIHQYLCGSLQLSHGLLVPLLRSISAHTDAHLYLCGRSSDFFIQMAIMSSVDSPQFYMSSIIALLDVCQCYTLPVCVHQLIMEIYLNILGWQSAFKTCTSGPFWKSISFSSPDPKAHMVSL